MTRNISVYTSTLLCLLVFFAMHHATLVTSTQEGENGLPCPCETCFAPGDIAEEPTPGPEPVTFYMMITGLPSCDLYTVCTWTLIIMIIPADGVILTNVVVEEHLPAEYKVTSELVIPPPPLSDLTVAPMGSQPGKSAVDIIWFIPFLLGTAHLELEFATDENSAGHQEFTSCGCYNLNSGGISLNYDQAPGKYSHWGWRWQVDVPCPPEATLFSDALRILPIVTLSGALLILRRRR